MTRLSMAVVFCLLVTAAVPAHGTPDESPLVFASVARGRQLLGSQDTFTAAMSPFDRAARLKTDQDVSQEQFLVFVRNSVLPWEEGEKEKIASAFRAIRPALAKLTVTLPQTVHLIKTSGAEEGGAAYTRGNAIVFPRPILAASDRDLQRTLAHELLHVITRNDSQLRDLLYQTIGFDRCGELDFPPALRSRKITNPDTPKNEHCIRVRVGGEWVWAVPILFSRTPKYDTRRAGEFFEYLQLALVPVVKSPETGIARPISGNQDSGLVAVQNASDLFEQVGRNTRYVIHPEEILADNFALLVLEERDVPSPEILERVKSVFTRGRSAEPSAPAVGAGPRR